MKYYAGIGARDTPQEVRQFMYNVAKYLATKDITLRSGAADGADNAFELGCISSNGYKQIFLPWKGFNNNLSTYIDPSDEAFDIAKQFHPAWNRLSQGAKKLQARNSHQILGPDLNTPSDFVICYTKDGKLVGGTSQAIKVANHYNIPVFNIGSYNDIEECRLKLWEFLKQFIGN